MTRFPLQRAVLVVCLLQLGFAAAGFAVNPDFATGASATSVRLLGVDFNGWHAFAGLLLFGPGLVAARRLAWTRRYAVAAVAVLLGTAVWGYLDQRPLGLLFFPDGPSDAVFHVVSAAAFVVLLVVDRLFAARPVGTT